MASEIVAIDPLEKEMATHSGTLTWKISWTQKPGGLQFVRWQRVGHDWATEWPNDFTFTVSVLPEELSKTIGQINHPILGIPGWTYWIQEAVFIMMKTWIKHSGRYLIHGSIQGPLIMTDFHHCSFVYLCHPTSTALCDFGIIFVPHFMVPYLYLAFSCIFFLKKNPPFKNLPNDSRFMY